MDTENTADIPVQECGLIVQQEGKPQQVLAKFLNLMLNYQYGLAAAMAPDLPRAALLSQSRPGARCVCVIQNQEVRDQATLTALGQQGHLPLFLILPQVGLDRQQQVSAGLDNIHYCTWESAFSHTEGSLQHIVGTGLNQSGVGSLFQDIEKVPYPVMQQRVERRLKNINTLPTLPEIIMRIMRLVNDPQTTTEELEQVLCSDPAIVMKLLQVMRSPMFAGTTSRGKWTLTEIIVRLGLKKVGAIAQQIKLINSLVKPEESDFDLRRFWEHSVGCAVIADKLFTKKMLSLKSPIEFNDYWVAALLHDAGKLVLGFFFWDWFARVVEQMPNNENNFRRAEARLGNVAHHEGLGRLLLMNGNMGEEVAEVVGTHHTPGEAPGDLACLVHMANNLAKDLELGYLPDENGYYDETVLKALNLSLDDVGELMESLAEGTIDEVKSMVEQCL